MLRFGLGSRLQGEECRAQGSACRATKRHASAAPLPATAAAGFIPGVFRHDPA